MESVITKLFLVFGYSVLCMLFMVIVYFVIRAFPRTLAAMMVMSISLLIEEWIAPAMVLTVVWGLLSDLESFPYLLFRDNSNRWFNWFAADKIDS
ncbi:MAG: hypothetical protein HYW34_02370 [Candidatus Brennerbacteria bacterium]|nr:hypothetical protein [Candidatus Brennerbacteria bacterium]